MKSIRIKSAGRIEAEIRVPGDKSISHRAVLLSALSNGVCEIGDFLAGEDCVATIVAMRALGVRIEQPEPTRVIVHGARARLAAPDRDLDCGNSGTTMRLLSGILAAQEFESRLVGDESLSRRPMGRVIQPLEAMGATIRATGPKRCPPLRIRGGRLEGIEYELPVASAQVKSAILLAGLFARGKTSVIEPLPTRDHTERMLKYFLVPVRRSGQNITVHGGALPESRDVRVPGDISSAAFWLAAAAAQPGARLLVRGVGLNPTRTGILSVLVRMGARVREVVEEPDAADPWGCVEIRGRGLKATTIEGGEIPNVIDELPVLAVAAALAEGQTVIRDAAELRVKETDRLAAVAGNLRLMGVDVREFEDGLEIRGPARLHGARLRSFGDHRIAMAFAVAGLFARGETVIEDTACVNTSYPGFVEVLEQLQGGKQSARRRTPAAATRKK